ncbi:hypothetical protein ACFJIY_07625 [Pimelobacter simplex]|uniref:hypothetical protein n=1 Tax=Nocardioides simplex TaxID=2045 RepID=UPI0036715C6D
MSDTTAAPAAEPTTDPTAATTDPTAQGDPAELGDGGKKALDAERTARKAAEKATADLQKQLDEINRANETAIEKAQREAKEAQEVAAKATTDALRFRVAAKHGISDDDADLFLTGSDEATLARQAARLVERTPTSPLPDPTQGGKGGTAPALNSNALEQALKNKLGIS